MQSALSASAKHHGGRINGNGNNNNSASGNLLYSRTGDAGDQQGQHQHHQPGCRCLGCQGKINQSLLQPPTREHATMQQGGPVSQTISNTTMSTV